MSEVVALRLQEMAERQEERRGRVSEIRRESRALLHHLQELCAEFAGDSAPRAAGAPPAADKCREDDLERPATGVERAGVLREVEHLLGEIDTRAREHWSEEDVVILVALHEVLAAAARKGYSLGELQALLERLHRSGRRG